MEASNPPKIKKRCEVCNIEILSSSFAKHLGSKNHQKMLQDSMEILQDIMRMLNKISLVELSFNIV